MSDHSKLIEMITSLIPEMEKYFIRPFVLLTKETVSASQLKILMFLSGTEKATMSELAKRLEMPPPQLTSLIDGLVKMDFVERCYEQHDRRSISVKVTPKAMAFYARTQERALEFSQNWLSTLSDEETDELYHSILTVKSLLSKAAGAGMPSRMSDL